MSFLKRIFTGEMGEQSIGVGRETALQALSPKEMEAHLEVDCYGDFQLTGAVRPSYHLQVIPQQGYRRESFRDRESGAEVPMLTAAASEEILFELFMDLLGPLGNIVDMVLETSHHCKVGEHDDLYREHIDMPVLKSVLWDYEDLLTNDGCSGIAVLNPSQQQEVQFDEHKILLVYGNPLDRFEEILESYGVPHRDDVQFITEAEHVHSSRDEYSDSFDLFRTRIGAESYRG
ncbi:MAG: hypothetical protein VB855_08220 [Pirellulaceae bacterium]